MIRLASLSAVLLWLMAAAARAEPGDRPLELPLWPGAAPGSEGKSGSEQVRLSPLGEHIITGVHRPSLTPYLPTPDRASGTAIIVIPGGGHRELWMDHEGYRVGQWFRDHGIAAFVLKYRLSLQAGSTYTIEGHELADVRRAIRLVKSHASDWHLVPERVGIIGFSAGGELAALAGASGQADDPSVTDPVERRSATPAFIGLIYPALPHHLSLSAQTPPTFLLCGTDDSPAIAQSVPRLFQTLQRNGTRSELHVLSGVGHGFGIRDTNTYATAHWPQLFYDWLGSLGELSAPPPSNHP